MQNIYIHTVKIYRIETIEFHTLEVLNTAITEFANTEDPDEMAHYEPSHLDLHCLPF